MTPSQTVQKHREFLFPAVAMYYDQPLAIERGEGAYVWDDAGNRYLDAFGGVLTISVGHANPKVVAAIVEQVKKLSHMSTLYANRPQSELAERLAQIAPGKLKKSFFTNSGTEANETAFAAARHATGRQEIVALRHSYSGRAAQTLAASAQAPWKRLPAQVPGFVHAHAPYCYRCPFHLTYPECGIACADDIEELIRTCTTGEIAAFMAETILGSGGFIVPPPGYFERAVAIARKYGGLFIADEVQTAWGRTGDKWFGIEHWNVEPDLIVSAKGMGNGAPVAVTIATPEVADKYPGTTFATFGGNPVSMAAALATLQVIEDDDLATNARVVGAYLREELETLQQQHPLVGDVRGMGLMQGLELVSDRKTKEPAPQAVLAVFEETKRRGVLIGRGGLYANVIRLSPPLNATKAHVDELVDALDHALAFAARQ
jgi:alanine-glyoxylate transaminase / (R)-3-amino-2-methylpropionate-pyruvate transaminase